MRRARHSLRTRIVCIVVGGVLATSIIFSLAAFTLAYSIEDRLFQRTLAEEAAFQKSFWSRTGTVADPKNANVAVYRGNEPLPLEIRREVVENPRETEFFGSEGRHYHILRFDLNDGIAGGPPEPAAVVIEVRRDLLVRPFRESFIELLVLTGALAAVLMGSLAWWLVNRAMKPLNDLVSDINKAESEIPNIDPSNYPANEIGTVAEALVQAFRRIRGFVDREQAFTRDASHELRTPLAVVRGAAEVIALNRNLPPHLDEPMRRIDTATTDMTLALDQLLALARENRGMRRHSSALRPMIEKAISWATVRYPDSQITVSSNVDYRCVVKVHPTSLQLVLNNVIGNCFQHVRAGKLMVDFEGDSLVFVDDGPGIESGAEPFEAFAKGTGSTGSGLGLDISRRLCEAAGMQLVVERPGRDGGACFRLFLGNVSA